MKQVQVEVRPEDLQRVLDAADRHRGLPPSHFSVESPARGAGVRILVNLPNEEVGPFVGAIAEGVEEASFVIPAVENIPLDTPLGDVRDRVADVSARSALELVLDVLQSLGTWQGMLLYAVVSGLVAAYGVLFNLWFLLTAAMLIAPVGAPAMVAVVATAVGDVPSLRRGLVRFLVSVLVLVTTAALLGLTYGISAPTPLMETLTSLSMWSGLVGLAGGAAGAQALVQAERDSLVTATATGFLVAVSLSPPSAVLGLAAALGRWTEVLLMAFLLALTLSGIIAGGWAALRLQGIRPARTTAGRGSTAAARFMVGAATVALIGLMVVQSRLGPDFRKSDLARKGAEIARQVVAEAPGYRVLEVESRFVNPSGPESERPTLLLTILAERTRNEGAGNERPTATAAGAAASETDDPASAALRAAVRDRVRTDVGPVRPLVQLSIVR